MRQRTTHSAPPHIASIPGPLNCLADTASRIEKVLHPSSPPLSFTPVSLHELLTLFNSKFPLQQGKSWHGVTIPPALTSLVISSLRQQRLPLQQWMVLHGATPGQYGANSANLPTSTLGCKDFPALNVRLTSWLLGKESDADTIVIDGQSRARRSKRLYATFHKDSCWLDSTTLGKLSAPPT